MIARQDLLTFGGQGSRATTTDRQRVRAALEQRVESW
jgi:hypothetical protein